MHKAVVVEGSDGGEDTRDDAVERHLDVRRGASLGVERNVVTLAVRSRRDVEADGVARVDLHDVRTERRRKCEHVHRLVPGRICWRAVRAATGGGEHENEYGRDTHKTAEPMKSVGQQSASFRLTIGSARTLALAVVATILAACGSDSPSGPGTATSPEGNYTISTINGKAVPMAMFADTGGYKLEILAGTLGVQSGGKYSVTTSY